MRICGLGYLYLLYWTGLTGLIGSIAFLISGRKREITIPASKGGEKKAKETDNIVAECSCRLFVLFL
jgi:hypothetical protein